MIEIIKVIILSIVEGMTEFLPVSSTGHLILVNEFVGLEPEGFANAFNVIIQLGAILSVVFIYFDRFNFWSSKKSKKEKIETIDTIRKVIVAFMPAAILGGLFDDMIDKYLFSPIVVIAMLFIWGIIIIFMERLNKKRTNKRISSIKDISYKKALQIGFMQCFAMIPGTSRSAATIIGAMMMGVNREVAAEFSFFLAIPTMLGATVYKMLKIAIKGVPITTLQIFLIILGMVLSFFVALIVISKFMGYIKNHDFQIFGYYRIILSIIVFIYFLVIK